MHKGTVCPVMRHTFRERKIFFHKKETLSVLTVITGMIFSASGSIISLPPKENVLLATNHMPRYSERDIFSKLWQLQLLCLALEHLDERDSRSGGKVKQSPLLPLAVEATQ